jgi:DNA-directed RNA polymerase specialized sigma24 family protein
VRNTALDYLREKKDVPFSSFLMRKVSNYIEDTIKQRDINAELKFEQYENKKEIEELLESLSPNHRQIFYILYFNE